MAVLLTKNYQLISTISLSYGEYRTYARYLSQDEATNVTTYNIKTMYYTSQSTLSFSSATSTVDGTSKSLGYTTLGKGETAIQDINRTITHNADGSTPTKNIATSWTATFGGSGSTNADVIFPKINRYATITSAPDFNDEANPTINYSNPGGNNVSSLQAGIFNTSGNTAYANYRDVGKTGSSYTFNLTTAERNALRNATPNSNTLQVKFYLKTVVGSNTFYQSVQKTMTIVNGNPTFTHSEVETNTVVSNALGSTSASTIVKNLSKVKFTITPSAKKGASISKVELTHSGSTSSDTSSPYEFTITPTSNSFVVKTTDSRGNSTSTTITKTLLNYEPVKILSFSFRRTNPTSSNILINLEATYWNTNVGSVTNAPVVKWKMNDGTQTTIPSSSVTIDNTNHRIRISNYTLSNQLVYTSGATFYIYVNDAYSSTSNSTNVTKGIPVLDLGDDEVQVNGDFIIADTSENNMYKLNNIVGMFNDTSGSNWEAMMKNKIDYCINHINTTKGNAQAFINGGWSGVNYGFGLYSKIGGFNQLVWFSKDYSYYCRRQSNGTYEYSLINSYTKTTDANGWTKLVHNGYTEYFKKGTFTVNYSSGPSWGTAKVSDFPVGVTKSNNIFFSSGTDFRDASLTTNVCVHPTSNQVNAVYYWHYNGSINTTITWWARIIKFS
jgi:hypothetical protein